MNATLGRKATSYLFFEIWPSLILGVLVFILILLMAQALRLTEFVLVHGISFGTVIEIMSYLSVSFLPAILPMSLLFAVIMTYGRLSQDSEIVALKAVGYSQAALTLPALAISIIIAFISAQTSFRVAPWGNRQFEVLITQLSQTRAGATLKEGTFSEGFFDLVVYANKVNSQNGKIEKVFIYDARGGDIPLTIISKKGQILQDPKKPGHSALLQLTDGDIHRKTDTHTKIKFGTFEVKLSDPIKEELRAKTPPSLTLREIADQLKFNQLGEDDRRILRIEWHKRWAITIACIIFGLLGVGLGTQANRRSQKAGGLVLSLGVIIGYWILYVSFEGLARSNQLPVTLALWIPNFIFAGFAYYRLKLIWN